MAIRALVTGGAGFIGSTLVDGLLDTGHSVDVVDDLSTGRAENLTAALDRGARLHEVDVRDGDATGRLVAHTAAEVIFHLAARIDVRESVSDPVGDLRTNVEGTVNVLEAARRNGVRRVVYSSTGGALYGDAAVLPTTEDAPIAPQAPYGQSKHAAEGYCALYARLHGMSTISLRYANVYGPRQDPLGEGGVVAIFTGRSAAGKPLIVYGDGTQTRDYVHVDDVVQANLAALDSTVTAPVNVGTAHETSVLDLGHAVGQAVGTTFDPEFAPARPGEIARSALDPSLARDVLGWAPAVALEAGLASLVERTRE